MEVGQHGWKVRDQQGLMFVPRQFGHVAQQHDGTAPSWHAPPRGW
jgi:hypothetical protein